MLAIISLSARLRGERVGVRWAAVQRLRLRKATSPSHAGACPRAALCADPWGVGPFLSPLKGGEGFLTGPARCVHALARKRERQFLLCTAPTYQLGTSPPSTL